MIPVGDRRHRQLDAAASLIRPKRRRRAWWSARRSAGITGGPRYGCSRVAETDGRVHHEPCRRRRCRRKPGGDFLRTERKRGRRRPSEDVVNPMRRRRQRRRRLVGPRRVQRGDRKRGGGRRRSARNLRLHHVMKRGQRRTLVVNCAKPALSRHQTGHVHSTGARSTRSPLHRRCLQR